MGMGSEPEYMVQLHQFLSSLTDHEDGKEKNNVYGRICATKRKNEIPRNFSDVPLRKTVFLFGPATVFNVVKTKDPYDMLKHLGLLPEYIHLKACILQSTYWLILFKLSEDKPYCSFDDVLPATWSGLQSFINRMYPEAAELLDPHWIRIKFTPVSVFEEEASIKFIDALENPHGPHHLNYNKFKKLNKPVKAWQARLFLYCELRILELFKGDGYTYSKDGTRGEKEYIAPNYQLQHLKEDDLAVIPINVIIPDDIHKAAKKCELYPNGNS